MNIHILIKLLYFFIGPQLKVVSTTSVGYDHVSVSELKKRGVLLGNTPDILTDATVGLYPYYWCVCIMCVYVLALLYVSPLQFICDSALFPSSIV